MLQHLLIPALLLSVLPAFSQASGNANYERNTGSQSRKSLPKENIDVDFENGHDIIISIKGLSNIKADAYVATFSVTQVGSTAEEVNRLMDERISEVKKAINITDFTIYLDMVTFVPMYEYEVEKKTFSKKTFVEVPKGFELKKNLHISYKSPQALDNLISVCAVAEIYDLVKVDYVCNNLEEKKKELVEKAKLRVKEKIKNYQEIIGVDLTVLEKDVVDGFAVSYPVEMYPSYQAYASTSLQQKKSSNVNAAEKSTTMYYQAIVDKEFDFVLNPVIVEPVIQVLYEVKVRIRRAEKTTKEVKILTPSGELKTILLDK